MSRLFKFNLQLHSGEVGGGGSDGSSAPSAESSYTEPASIRSVTDSLMGALNGGSVASSDDTPPEDAVFSMDQPPASQDPVASQVVDPVVQTTVPSPAFDITAMINEIKQLSDQVSTMNQTPKQQEAVVKTEQAIQTKYGLQPDEFEKITSGLQDKLYDNPQAFTDDIMKLVESRVNEQMGPINGLMENLNFQKAMTDFGNAHPDLGTYEGEMVKVIEEFRSNKALGIDVEAQKNNPAFHEMVYNMAKGRTVQAPKTIDDFLSDEESLAKIASHDTVKARYLKQLADDVNSKRPPTMPGKATASAPLTPPTRATTVGEVTKSLLNSNR